MDSQRAEHIEYLDGWRGLAILFVLVGHFFPVTNYIYLGRFGVDVFFVISGYLITSILIKDIDKGRFSLVHFYERRARRILPALYLTCFITIITCYFLMAPWELKLLSESLIYVVFLLPFLLGNYKMLGVKSISMQEHL